MLTEATISIIKEIAPVVAENAEAVTCCFYAKMFEGNPEVKAFFYQSHRHSGGQQKALSNATFACFASNGNMVALGPAVELIAQKHCSLGVESESYPIVGKHLLVANKEVMVDGATDEIFESIAELCDVVGQNYDVVGRVSASHLRQSSDLENAICFFCGPKPLMRSVCRSLRKLGVDKSRIRFEFFGPRQKIVD